MNLQGNQYIGFTPSGEGQQVFQAINPVSGEKLMPFFKEATVEEIALAGKKASNAFQLYRLTSGAEKAHFLTLIAEHIEKLGDDLLQRCHLETGLPLARITGERGRTVGQLKLFAALLKEGSWVNASIDLAQSDRQPLPKPDIRSMQIALGPVAVFGASNFPLAFSVAGLLYSLKTDSVSSSSTSSPCPLPLPLIIRE